MKLPFEAEALAEFEDAVAWYERERRGRGAAFASEVSRAVERAAILPRSGPRAANTDPDRDIRRFVIRRFPYLVVTALVVGRRAVVAVAHERRRPGYWRERVKSGRCG